MRPETVIGLKARDGWKPAIGLLQEWRRAGAAQALNPALVFADRSGRPTALFLGLYRKAFDDDLRPDTPIVEDRRPTPQFLDAWRRLA